MKYFAITVLSSILMSGSIQAQYNFDVFDSWPVINGRVGSDIVHLNDGKVVVMWTNTSSTTEYTRVGVLDGVNWTVRLLPANSSMQYPRFIRTADDSLFYYSSSNSMVVRRISGVYPIFWTVSCVRIDGLRRFVGIDFA